ncbi:unannotated protein [freshwater metagenome]|uniref:Unannotated protein n=1 Tax=freshwater metagenome TaxID=449393 RepID=A0A6J6I106_9ZZZZ
MVRHARARNDKSSPDSAGCSPYRCNAPCATNERKYDISVCPSGHGNGGSFGATSDKSKAMSYAKETVRSTTPGYRAKRRCCSAGDRK